MAGVQLELEETPLVIVNGWLFRGAPSMSDITRVLDRSGTK
jgi:hypothetical protein